MKRRKSWRKRLKIYRQLCQVYGHTTGVPAGRCLIIIHSIARTSIPMISISSYTSRNSCSISFGVFIMIEAEISVIVVPIPGGRLLQHRIQKLVLWYYKFLSSEVNMLQNSLTLAVSLPVNLSIKLGFVSVNGTRETYFVDALSSYCVISILCIPDLNIIRFSFLVSALC